MEAGTVVGGRYRIVAVAGRGGGGTVLHAVDDERGDAVAIKVHAGDGALPEQLTPHPNLPAWRDRVSVNGSPHDVFDWVSGESLAEIAARAPGGRLSLAEVLDHLDAVAAALTHLHNQGLVHLDVKPANVVVDNGGTAVLVDLGSVRPTGARVERVTAGFSAPELATGGTASVASDVFSLAATAIALVTGEAPRPGLDLAALPAHVGEAVSAAVATGMAADPDQRPPSVAALVDLLRPRDAPSSVPAPADVFVGREETLVEVREALGSARVVTLAGAGGSGKTRLALEVARAPGGVAPDGVWVVELAGVPEPGLVGPAVAAALGLKDEPGRPAHGLIEQRLQSVRGLVVLDNCEHVLGAASELVRRVIEQCPGVRFLTTSREPLGVASEVVHRVSSLDVPDPDAPAWAARQSPAVELFLARAERVRPMAAIDDASLSLVGSICRRLDGLPLAIEMAAARSRDLDLAVLADELDRHFLDLEGSRTSLPRHRTLRATLDWSYDRLDPTAQRAFRTLAAFAGPFHHEMAAFAGDDDTLRRLVDASLVVEEGNRHRLIEAVREYAGEKLQEAREVVDAAREHRRVYADLLSRADWGSAAQQEWIHRLDDEHDNVIAAIAGWLQAGDDPEGALRFVTSLWDYWQIRGAWNEARTWLERAAAVEGAPPEMQSRALAQVSAFAFLLGDEAAAWAQGESAMNLARAAGHRGAEQFALLRLGTMAGMKGDYDTAVPLLEQSLAIANELNDIASICSVTVNLGIIARRRREFDRALKLFEDALSVVRTSEEPWSLAALSANMANVFADLGDFDRARAAHEEALTIRQGLGDRPGVAASLRNLGEIARISGADPTMAVLYHEQSLEIERELGDHRAIIESLLALGDCAVADGRTADARDLYTEALAEAKSLNDPRRVEQCERKLAS